MAQAGWPRHHFGCLGCIATRDSRSLLSTIAYGGGNIDTRTYDAGGRLSSETLGNGQVVTRTYLTGDNLPLAISNSAVGTYTYGWEASPRRRPRREERGEDAVVSFTDKTSETVTGAMSGYGFSVPTNGYDDQNRLTAWNRTNGTKNQSWALSAVGDWNSFVDAGVTQARTHGPAHELLTMGAATVLHDSRGNMTQDEQAKAFTWDASNMLKQAVVPAGATTGVVGTHTYQYDVLGRRVRKTTGGTGASDTVFVRDGQTVVAEYTATSAAASPLRKYVNASYVDEPVLLIDRTAAGSVGAGTDERFYYHRNQQYSITALTDNSGAVLERYAYTAYGEPTILDGAGTTTRTTSFINNTYLYTAQEYDAETGLYHFNARMYEGRQGRFLSHDPIMYPDGANTYAGWFASSGVDPFGLFASCVSLGYSLVTVGGISFQEILCTDDCGNWFHGTWVTLKFGLALDIEYDLQMDPNGCLSNVRSGVYEAGGVNLKIGVDWKGLLDGKARINAIDITYEAEHHLYVHHGDLSHACPCKKPPAPLPPHPTTYNAEVICGACHDACSKSCNLSDSDPDGDFPECMDRCTAGDLSVFEDFSCPGWKGYINP